MPSIYECSQSFIELAKRFLHLVKKGSFLCEAYDLMISYVLQYFSKKNKVFAQLRRERLQQREKTHFSQHFHFFFNTFTIIIISFLHSLKRADAKRLDKRRRSVRPALLTKIFGKLKVKFHIYMCAVPQTCKSDKKYCSQNSSEKPLVSLLW